MAYIGMAHIGPGQHGVEWHGIDWQGIGQFYKTLRIQQEHAGYCMHAKVTATLPADGGRQ